LAVFLVGFILYYFFLSNTDLSTVLTKIKPVTKTAQNQKESALLALEKQNLESYRTWIAQYYFDVSDVAIIEPDADNSGNGLSNFQKFLLGLNPRDYDTLSLGMADSQAIALGINPLTGNSLTDKQKEIVEKYFDMEVIMNRLTLSNLNNSRNVAGVNTNNQQQSYQNSSVGANALGSSPNYNFNTNSRINSGFNNQNQSNYTAPQTGADLVFGDSEIDQTKPGLLEIPSLKVSAPIVWTSNPKNFDRDLQSGVVHYPGTAMPGQIGTTYISGHSSNVPWAKGSYNQVFSRLGDLGINSSFIITVYTKEGKTFKYHYVVNRRAEFKATDQEQFKNSGTQTVALSTCWPVNTTQKRLVVFGELTQTER
jgi:LPXTG-site transpeptidase (sortase) family protein